MLQRKSLLDRSTVLWCIAITVAIELVCLILRFGFDKDSTTETASTIGVLTFGIRIHHGYIGAMLIPIAVAISDRHQRWGRFLLIVGVGLFVSDVFHHFVVLWLITGSPQFDLVYP